jgi:hypothetical protein
LKTPDRTAASSGIFMTRQEINVELDKKTLGDIFGVPLDVGSSAALIS